MIFRKSCFLSLLLLAKSLICPADDETQKASVLASSRKQTEYLPMSVWVPAPDVRNKAFWDSKRDSLFAKKMILLADKALEIPPETPSLEYYRDYSTNGNRTRYEKVYAAFRNRYNSLSMALCITRDTDKYLKQWQAYNKVLCDMPTWVLPAHDKELKNLNREFYTVDLVSSAMAATVAMLRHILSPIISEEDKKSMYDAVWKQVIHPYVEMSRNQRPHSWFISTISNWNAVCNSNSLLALLATDMPADQKRDAITLILASIRNYYKGFASDGYCTEGISYWSYGFGHYMKLAVTLHCASNGKLDMMTPRIIQLAARFPERFQLTPRSYPAFADCSFNSRVSLPALFIRNWLLKYPTGSSDKIIADLQEQLLIWNLPQRENTQTVKLAAERISAFPDGGVFIFRHPRQDGLNFVCKGGSNNELHNHNDVGTFSAVCNYPLPVVGDLGGTVYTRATFTNRRYENKLLSSYGHPVPLIDDIQQSPGEGTKAKLLKFTDSGSRAEVVFDLRNAYPLVKGMKKLERSFRYDFDGRGKVVIEDNAVFASPRSFETALPTFGKITQLPNGKLQAEYLGSRIDIAVDSAGVPWQLTHESLTEVNTHWKAVPQRYAVVLEGKHKKVRLALTITPAE